MKITTQKLPDLPYSLHDMSVTNFLVDDTTLTFQLSALIRIAESCQQVNGCIRFRKVDWDFCFVYILDFLGNEGSFSGEKMSLNTFIKKWDNMHFDIIDETYNWHIARFSGWLSIGEELKECVLEISFIEGMDYIEY